MKLMMTEKKDQAIKIAEVMGWKQGKGCFDGMLEGEPIKMVWARGHLVTLKNPDEVVENLSWNEPEKLLPIPQLFPLKINDDIPGAPAAAQPKTYVHNISKFIKDGISEFIIATDSDREGEAIGWYLLKYLNYTGPVRRVWLAAGLDKKSIKEAMVSIRPASVTKSWYRAAEARGRSDWAYMFLVRAYTHFASYSVFGKNLGQGQGRSSVVSVGRVQTPALSMVVRRDIEIENFVSKDHFKISGDFIALNSTSVMEASYSPDVTSEIINSQPVGVTWEPSSRIPKDGEPEPLDSPLFTDKAIVDAFKARLLAAANQSTVLVYKEGVKKESPPKTFSLVDAQVAISKKCKISANLAQTILEDLYEQGWTSYARTSKSDLPMNFYEDEQRNTLLSSLLKMPETTKQAKEAMDIHNNHHQTYKKFTPSVFSNKQLEHHGIVPTSQVMTPEAFKSLTPAKKDSDNKIKHTTEQMQAAYMLVAMQFIQALYPPAQFATQDVSFSVPVTDLLGNKESVFSCKGEKIIDEGWKKAFGAESEKNTTFPVMKNGESVKLTGISTRATQTKPPVRYTETTYQKAMGNIGREVRDPQLRKRLSDSDGIGTPATRKTIVETLLARGYIEEKKGTYYSTNKGRDLIAMVPEWMSSPETTALWEDYLVKICEQKDDAIAIKMRDEFTTRQIGNLEKLINSLIEKYSGNLGEKITQSPSVVSERMKEVIKNICTKKGIPMPRGILSNPKMANDFLGEHLKSTPKPADGAIESPSENQINLLKLIINSLPENTYVPDDVYKDKSACSKFLEKYKNQLKPSAAQIDLANKIISKLPTGTSVPDNVLTSSAACSKFISEQTKGWKKKPAKK